jgi:uncharacterized membrane protein YkvA (DUF1232 family)
VSGLRILTKIIDWFATPYSLFLILRNPEISWKSKLKAILILAATGFYILDPWDLVSDFIPFIGWLDDLIILPAGMAIADRIVPEVSLSQIRHKARSTTKRVIFWTIACAIGLVFISLAILGLLITLAIKTWL